jgi:hypothetical protein
MQYGLVWGMQRLLTATVVGLGLTLTICPASAVVVGGGVTSYSCGLSSASFILLSVPFTDSDPDNTVGNNDFDLPNLYAFNEDQNITLSSGLTVDVGTNPSAGQIVASHYVFFDPASTNTIEGYVDFDAAIYGVATSRTNLANSDFLANTGVTYENPTLRGLESVDWVKIDPGNDHRLLVHFNASSPGDYVRVFTQKSVLATPLPASLPLFAAGLGVVGLVARSRKRKRAA